jgi:hypothetical protein
MKRVFSILKLVCFFPWLAGRFHNQTRGEKKQEMALTNFNIYIFFTGITDFNLAPAARPSGIRSINLKPKIWKDQIKRRICEIIRCDNRGGQTRNDTAPGIIFTPIKPPDFDKKEVEKAKPPVIKPKPVFSSPAGKCSVNIHQYMTESVTYPLST